MGGDARRLKNGMDRLRVYALCTLGIFHVLDLLMCGGWVPLGGFMSGKIGQRQPRPADHGIGGMLGARPPLLLFQIETSIAARIFMRAINRHAVVVAGRPVDSWQEMRRIDGERLPLALARQPCHRLRQLNPRESSMDLLPTRPRRRLRRQLAGRVPDVQLLFWGQRLPVHAEMRQAGMDGIGYLALGLRLLLQGGMGPWLRRRACSGTCPRMGRLRQLGRRDCAFHARLGLIAVGGGQPAGCSALNLSWRRRLLLKLGRPQALALLKSERLQSVVVANVERHNRRLWMRYEISGRKCQCASALRIVICRKLPFVKVFA